MVEMALDLFDGEFGFVAELADYFLDVLFLYGFAVVTEIGLLFGKFLKTVASQVKAGVAFIAVENLVGIVVETAEAYFTISLKEFFIVGVFAFSRFHLSLTLDKLLQKGGGFIPKAMLKIFENGHRHEIVPDGIDLSLSVVLNWCFFPDGFDQLLPRLLILFIDIIEFLLIEMNLHF